MEQKEFGKTFSVNNTIFSKANGLYQAGDFRGALRKYTECLKSEGDKLQASESGELYHHIGNCLMKMKNPTEAIKAYRQAELDSSYNQKGALHTNIGKALCSLHCYEDAVKEFKAAVEDSEYKTKFRAYMGMGNAQLKLGNTMDAGKCFREAALDQENPDPAKSLLNLGVCFMSLNRPDDALQSYNSALEFEMSRDTRNMLQASMGQAYAANNQPAQAVEAFKAATVDGTYQLSDSAAVDYSRAVAEMARGVVGSPQEGDFSGLDVSVSDGIQATDDDIKSYDDGTEQLENVQGYIDAYEGDDEKFFTTSDEELKNIYKDLAKKDRKRRNFGLKMAIIIIVLVALIAGGGVFAYFQGYGFPTQETVAKTAFANPENPDGNNFARTLSSSSIKSMCECVVADSDPKILSVERSMTESSVYISAKTSQGGEVKYRITLVRDLISWKISNIELYFASQNQE